MKKSILFILTVALTFFSCDDLLSPADENFKDPSQMYDDTGFAQGLLMHTYRMIPAYYNNTEYATDDAVTNQLGNDLLNMATGSWASANSPSSVNLWARAYGAIQQINLFLENVDDVNWAMDEEASKLFATRMKGEAYGMRALFMYYLVRNHSGFTEDGRLLGVPVFKDHLDISSDFNQPRATFADCIEHILEDLRMAEELLPLEFEDISSDSQIPTRYQSITNKYPVYNRVMGAYSRGLFNGLAARSFRSRVTLLAASPAFEDASNTATWATAANSAASVLSHINGVSGMDNNGVAYYVKAMVDQATEGANPKEIVWRENLTPVSNNNTNSINQEINNFPPSLYGNGQMNPSKNLVDAFPMANGYPISDVTNSGYDASNPYAGRDPRLATYIIYNGNTAGTSNAQILTGSQSGNDGIMSALTTATRTGYYMKKRLRMDVNANPSSYSRQPQYTPRIRYTEIFLNYAEAANEAWGPTGSGGNGYSAYDVIKAIRTRAGVGTNNGDPYLEECKNDQIKMRELIRNERRLELCFESFRFWDLRRWKSNLNEPVLGTDASNGYSTFSVESRVYESYMNYGPIPHSEILKYNNLVQNKGW